MRLHRLVITGVGPFRDRQEIDFDALSESGLFLIDGATGSGKTTIIDSIVYSLFGVVSGGADSDPARIRSSYCGEKDPTGVECDFSVNGRRHRITRVPAGARDPQEPDRAATAKPARQILVEFAPDGSELTRVVRSRDVADHVEGLLRMNAAQFAQLVVLPQGQFAELLRMSPTARLESLASLLGDEFFRLVQEDLKQQGDRAIKRRGAARDAVTAAAQRLSGRLRGYLDPQDPRADFTDPAVADDERKTAVVALLDGLSTRAITAAKQRDDQALVTEAGRKEAEAAALAADALKQVGDARESVARAQESLDPVDQDVDATSVIARLGDLSVRAGALGEHAAWESQAAVRSRERAELAQHAATSRGKAAELRAQRDALPAMRTEAEASLAAAQTLAGTVTAAVGEEGRLAGLVAKAEELRRLTPELAALESTLTLVEQAQVAAVAAAEQSGREVVGLVTSQLGEQAAALATTLEAGSRCPVCGSTEHPQPALPPGGVELVTDEAVENAKRIERETRDHARAAAASTTAARTAWQQMSGAIAALTGALDGQPDVENRYSVAREIRRAAEVAADDLPELSDRVADLTERATTLADEISELELAAGNAESILSEREAAETARNEVIRGLIGAANSAADLLAETTGRIDALSTLQQAQVTLGEAAASVPADRRHLTLDQADEQSAQAAHELQDRADLLTELTGLATSLADVVADAAPLAGEFTAALDDRQRVENETAAAIYLAALVTAKNSKNLPLRSYALQRRFEAVLAAATVHLERMSSGKFTFEPNDQAGAGYAGLGILLRDAWTGHQQEPKSLSGGETFYASLSLALGLADVVRGEGAGSELETLFIDEGFGSLDQDTLYQVLEQLDKLRAGRRAVGVVSHVTEMRESIPDRIEVRRQADSTSTVRRPEGSSTP